MNYANSSLHDMENTFDAMLRQAGDDPEARLAAVEAIVCAVDNKLRANDTYMRYQALCRRIKQMHEELDAVERLASEIGDLVIMDLAGHAKYLLK